MLPTISATMIIKNEAENLPRCLSSIINLVDEIIIVDTGSTDNSIEIAKSYGKKVKIYCHEWQDDFSLHRNQAFSYASGDWYLVIDADEELMSSHINPVEFKHKLSKITPQVAVLLVNTIEERNGVKSVWPGFRFLRASSKPVYTRCVHNKLKFEGYTAFTDIDLIHYGYTLSPEKMKVKRSRTKVLLNKLLSQNKFDPSVHYYLAQLAMGEKDYTSVIEHSIKCFEYLNIIDPHELQYYASIYTWISSAYIHKAVDETDKELKRKYTDWAFSWLSRGLEFFKDDPDLNYIMAHFYYFSNDIKKSIKYCNIYLKSIKSLKSKSKNQKKDIKTFMKVMNIKDVTPRTQYYTGEQSIKIINQIKKEAGRCKN